MLGRHNDLFGVGNTAEENMRYNVIRYEAAGRYEIGIYKEAARRVIFDNCMKACEINDKSIPNFNKNFYYHQVNEQRWLEECYNTRMKLHFGSLAEKEGMLLDVAAM